MTAALCGYIRDIDALLCQLAWLKNARPQAGPLTKAAKTVCRGFLCHCCSRLCLPPIVLFTLPKI
jgi:hypothetical protein